MKVLVTNGSDNSCSSSNVAAQTGEIVHLIAGIGFVKQPIAHNTEPLKTTSIWNTVSGYTQNITVSQSCSFPACFGADSQTHRLLAAQCSLTNNNLNEQWLGALFPLQTGKRLAFIGTVTAHI